MSEDLKMQVQNYTGGATKQVTKANKCRYKTMNARNTIHIYG